MERISQEFFCGECTGYFLIRLRTDINHEALIVCPNCAHEHRRCIKDGQIYESGRYNTDVKEKVRTTVATYAKTARTEQMQKKGAARRDGVPIMSDQWLAVAARERGED